MAKLLINDCPMEEIEVMQVSNRMDISSEEPQYEEITLNHRRDSNTSMDQLPCPSSPMITNFLETGYIGFGELVGRNKIIHHRSYHGEISGSEAAQLLSLAPEKGYLTRYSTNKKKYVLSVFCPSSSILQHFLIAVDEDTPSYVLQGTTISFQSIDGLLDHFESNPLSSKLEDIGISYSRINTRQFKLEHEKKRRRKAQEELVKAKQELEKAKQELEKAQKQLNEEETKKHPEGSIEPYSDKVKKEEESDFNKSSSLMEELEELKREKAELQQELDKKNNNKCKVQ